MPTSDPARCYVFIQLPGSLATVTCGLFEQQDGVGRFVYGKSYLSNPAAVELDGFELPLKPGEFTTARHGGIFGALRDASPDAWGRRVIERQLGRSDLNEVDYLLLSPEDRTGALSFGNSASPPAPVHDFNKIVQLKLLLEFAEQIENGLQDPSAAPLQVASLVSPGSSLGGARPKNVVEDAEGLWVAKFPSRSDRWNNAAVEGGMIRLAERCGLETPANRIVRVAGREVLLVRRFDREKVEGGYLRHRMVSALTVLRADEQRTNWSYVLLADEIRRWVADPDEDLRELYRRMVFNALISNTDDHPRNHALIAEGPRWRLSPVYDLTPAPQPSTERDLAMEITLTSRRARRENLLKECARFRYSREQASALIDQMKDLVSRGWRDAVLTSGGTQHDLAQIARAFDYEGFEYTG